MQRDLEALELVCRHYDAEYGAEALRKEKNRVRVLQRRLAKLEAEVRILKGGNARWREACQQWRDSFTHVQQHVRTLDNALRTQHWL